MDLDKANHGCRWAAYCTREAITEGNDPRATPVGAKRARELLAQGGELPPESSLAGALKATGASAYGGPSISKPRVSYGGEDGEAAPAPKPEPKPRYAPHLLAMDGKSALVPLRAKHAASENLMPPVRALASPCDRPSLPWAAVMGAACMHAGA